MTSSFGQRLKERREQRGVALETIAADTKIKAALLEALECGDVSQWPSGIFRRAYIRSYAQAIGLDPGPIVREFLELFPDPAEVIPETPDGEADAAQPANRLRRLVTSAIAAVPALQQASRRVTAPAAAPPREYVLTPDAGAPHQDPRAAVPGTVAVDAVVAMDTVGDDPEASDSRSALPASSTPFEDEFVLVPPEPVAVHDDPGEMPPRDPTLADAARLCTRLGRAVDRQDLLPVLEEAAQVLDAVGLVVWSWDPRASALRPSLGYGYPDAVLARMPVVRSDADNATADAFRSAEPCTVHGGRDVTGAAVIPLLGPARCVGVLALELRNGGEQREPVRALATILAAQLATLVGAEPMAEAATA